jgi:hypothetical protein
MNPRSFRSKGYQAEDGSGVGLLENVGKLKMMLRRKNACCLGRNRNRGQGAPTRGNRGRGTDSSNRVPSSCCAANRMRTRVAALHSSGESTANLPHAASTALSRIQGIHGSAVSVEIACGSPSLDAGPGTMMMGTMCAL